MKKLLKSSGWLQREYQRKGIGSRLLSFVGEWTRGKDFEVLVVKTSGDLYERRGFVRIALIDPYPGQASFGIY